MGDEKAPKLFCFKRWINGAWYGFNVPCLGWDDAQNLARMTNARLDGEHVMDIPAVPGTGSLIPNAIIRFYNWLAGRK